MIKKFIWIMNALQVLEALASGKRLVGELYIEDHPPSGAWLGKGIARPGQDL